ncbi:hypothetical protein DMO16_14430 [Fictibacillus sp. S7]|nr:hypothetical protein DMO16_14430 [Fictibacillus sp. S7]
MSNRLIRVGCIHKVYRAVGVVGQGEAVTGVVRGDFGYSSFWLVVPVVFDLVVIGIECDVLGWFALVLF